MKLLVVDYEKDYMMVMGYIFQPDVFDLDITYISSPDDLAQLDCSRYDACICDYDLAGRSNYSDVYEQIKSTGFKGRFVVIALAPEMVIVKDRAPTEGEIEVMDKTKSHLLRTLMEELSTDPKVEPA